MKEMCEMKEDIKDESGEQGGMMMSHRYGHKKMMMGGQGALYGLGFIGTAVYFIGNASSFWIGVGGFLKALVWPAFLVYEAFKFLLK